MKKWIFEDWAFDVEVIEGEAKNCRLGLEKGDVFHFEYETPQGFCPRAMAEIFTWCEVIRCGGDFTYSFYIKRQLFSIFKQRIIFHTLTSLIV